MEQLITHACGHEQSHFLTGFTSQQDRKARWLTTTKCRPCFIAGKKAEQQQATARDGAAIVHLDLPAIAGSDRQVAWATMIRANRLAALIAEPDGAGANICQTCLPITDAKWWIDHRDLSNGDLLAKAESCVGATRIAADPVDQSGLSQAASDPRSPGVVESTNLHCSSLANVSTGSPASIIIASERRLLPSTFEKSMPTTARVSSCIIRGDAEPR